MDIPNSKSNKIKFNCKYHGNFAPTCLLLNAEDENSLLCNQCLEDPKYLSLPLTNYQQIENLIKCDDQTIFLTWPPLENQSILLSLRQQLNNNAQNLENYKKITIEHFDLLQKEINKHIEAQKKQTLIQCNDFDDIHQEVISTYNNIADKQKMKDILLESESYESVNSQLKHILKQKIEQKKQNEQSLSKIFKAYQQQIEQFDKDKLEAFTSQILYIIQNINYFPTQNSAILLKSSSDEIDQIKKLETSTSPKSVLKALEESIQNPFNFFTSNYQQNLIQSLEQIKPLLENIKIMGTIEKYQDDLILSSLEEEQLDSLKQLTQKMINKKRDKNNQSERQQLELDFQNVKQIITNLDSETYEYKQLEKKYSLLPIFEIKERKMEFNISKYGLYEYVFKTKLNDDITQFVINSGFNYSNKILSSIILNRNKMYQVLFDYQLECLYVGLTSSGNEQCIDQSELFLKIDKNKNSKPYNKGIDTIKKGNKTDLFKSNSFSLSVNLQKCQFEISDFPHFSNTIEINTKDKHILQSNQLLQIAFAIYSPNACLTIKNITETF